MRTTVTDVSAPLLRADNKTACFARSTHVLRVFLCPKRVKMFICCFNNPDMDYLCKKAKSMVETSKIGKKIVKNASYFS